jgi:hypothetical protein
MVVSGVDRRYGVNEQEGSTTAKRHESKPAWEPMTLTQVGNLDVIQGESGSKFESSGKLHLMK